MSAFLAAAGCVVVLPVVAVLLFFAFRKRDPRRDDELSAPRSEVDAFWRLGFDGLEA